MKFICRIDDSWILQRIKEARVDFNSEYDILDWIQETRDIPNEALPPIYIEDILRGTESVGLLEFLPTESEGPSSRWLQITLLQFIWKAIEITAKSRNESIEETLSEFINTVFEDWADP